ncbi:cytochrome P450 [Streptomyces sp. NPDC058664]|uniref:cytochrome P450 n=1 Tax=unclassified Streptomyces TaxID=2593676 RepID=UPI0036686BB3
MECPYGASGQPPVIGADMLRDHAALTRLRESGTPEVSLGGRETGWMITRYEVAAAALVEPALRGDHPLAVSMRSGADEEACDEEQLFFLPADEHRRLRRTVSRHLTHRRVAALLPRIQREADRLLAAVPAGGTVDLVEAFSRPFPVAVLCELLGIPEAERRHVRDYVYGWIAEYGEATTVTESAGHALARYLGGLIEERADAPGDDLISAMLRQGGEDAELLRQDTLAAVRFLLVAGHRPVTRLLNDGLELLLEQREHWEALRSDRGRLDATIEELLRYVTPTALSSRYAAAPTEVDGAPLAAGSGAHCALVAVNRDPARFEEPDRFDPDRTPYPHLSFGLGHKHCLGAALARAEIRIAFDTLLTRFPRMTLGTAGPGTEPERRRLWVVLAPTRADDHRSQDHGRGHEDGRAQAPARGPAPLAGPAPVPVQG